jgi:hypothetical protein
MDKTAKYTYQHRGSRVKNDSVMLRYYSPSNDGIKQYNCLTTLLNVLLWIIVGLIIAGCALVILPIGV